MESKYKSGSLWVVFEKLQKIKQFENKADAEKFAAEKQGRRVSELPKDPFEGIC